MSTPYLREIEEDLDGVGDDIHAGHTPVAGADEGEYDAGGAALHQVFTAHRGQPGGRFWKCRHTTA